MYNIPQKYLDLANEFFNNKTKKVGLNKNSEKFITGFLIAEYEIGGIYFEPIIYNLTLKQELIDWERKGVSKEMIHLYDNYWGTKSFKDQIYRVYLFHDGENQHIIECPIINNSEVNNFVSMLNETFFILPSFNELKEILPTKPQKLYKIKI